MRHFLGSQTSRLFAHPKFNRAYFLTDADFTYSRASQIRDVLSVFKKPGTRLVEKSPANSVRTRFLQAVFPDASFVVVVRDGRAVAEGIRRRRLFDPERPHLAGLETTIEDAALQWVSANAQLVEDSFLLTRVRFVFYEELVERPDQVLGEVLDFLGLERVELNAVEFRMGLNETQIARLSAEERVKLEEIEGELLSKFGYGASGVRRGAVA